MTTRPTSRRAPRRTGILLFVASGFCALAAGSAVLATSAAASPAAPAAPAAPVAPAPPVIPIPPVPPVPPSPPSCVCHTTPVPTVHPSSPVHTVRPPNVKPTVVPTTGGPVLAVTGSDQSGALTLGFGLVVAGSACLVLARRRPALHVG